MSNNLLITWNQIHEGLFVDEKGRVSISMSTLQQKHGPKLKACGAVFRYQTGRSRTNVIAGWSNVIQNYFIKLAQQDDVERRERKKAKLANPYYKEVQELQE